MIGAPTNGPLQEPAGDIEMLHTDVMRFMAILGLCLTAIFALVQSVPLERQARAESERLEQTNEALRQRLRQRDQALTDALAREQALQQALDRRQTSEAGLRRALEAAERKLAAVAADRDQARQALVQALKERDSARKEERRQSLALETLRQGQRRLQAQNDRLLAQVRAGAAAADTPEPSRQEPAPPPKSERKNRPASVAGEAAEGFVLRFASSAALETLVAAGQVRFLVLSGDRAWRYRMEAGAPRLVPDRRPSRYHEMAEATVPLPFRQALATIPAAGDPVWAVVLPPALERQLQRLTRGRRGGVMEILASGRVELRGESG